MAVCEKCGVTFTPSQNPAEVTSLRILCVKCEAERRAEKLKKAQAATAAPAAPSQAAAARPAGAAPGASAAPAAPRMAGQAPAAGTPRPAAPAAGAARPAAAAPRPAASPAPAPAPAPAAPVRSAAARPAARAAEAAPAAPAGPRRPGARSAAASAASASPDVRREMDVLKEREGKTMKIVWAVCGVLAVVAALVLFNTISTTRERERVAREAQELLTNTESEFKRIDTTNEAGASLALQLGDDKRGIWKGTRIEGSVRAVLAKAQATVDMEKDRRDLRERLTTLESQIANASTVAPDVLKSARRTAQDLSQNAEKPGGDFAERVAKAKDQIDRVYLRRLFDDAKSKGSTRESLTALTQTEIDVSNALGESSKGKGMEDRKAYFTNLYKDVITHSDSIATAVFSNEAIERETWKDGLSAEQKSKWQKPGVEGFSLEDGQLRAIGPKAGSGKNGIITIFDAEQLRDFELECEFTPVRGKFAFYFRLYNRADISVASFGVSTVGQDAVFKPGQSYTCKARMIGSKITVAFPNTDITGYEEELGWTKQRFGAFGIEIHEESEIKITKLRVRELRSNKKP